MFFIQEALHPDLQHFGVSSAGIADQFPGTGNMRLQEAFLQLLLDFHSG